MDLALKFRPRSWQEVVGQPYIISIPNSWVDNGESYPIETYWIK